MRAPDLFQKPTALSLSNFAFFAGMPQALVEHLSRASITRSLSGRQPLYWEGDDATRVCLILDGWVKAFRTKRDGSRVLLALLGPGSIAGVTGILEGGAQMSSAITTGKARVLTFERKEFLCLAGRHPPLWRSLSEELNKQLGESLEMRANMALPVEGRLAALFLHLARKMGCEGDKWLRIPKVFTRQELSEFVSSTCETVIRILSRWRAQRIFETDRTGFLIRKSNALLELAGHQENGYESVCRVLPARRLANG